MGASANVYACVYMPTTPLSPLTFNFTPNDDACMNDSGSNQSLTVSTAGISQVLIGYVESKVSGCKCLSASSLWSLGYNCGPYSGSVSTQWYCPPEWNSIQLNNAGSTSVNTVAASSTATYQQWHGTTDLYIIFSPVADLLLKSLPVLKFFSPKEDHAEIDRLHRPLIDGYFLDRINDHFR